MRFVLCFAVAGALAALAVNLFTPYSADTPGEYASLVAGGSGSAALSVWLLLPRLRAAAAAVHLREPMFGLSTAVVAVAHVAFCGLMLASEFIGKHPDPTGPTFAGVLRGAAGLVVVCLMAAALSLVVVGWITVPFGIVAGLVAAAWERRAAARAEAATPFSGAVRPAAEEAP